MKDDRDLSPVFSTGAQVTREDSGAIILFMRKAQSHAELTELIRQGDGFIFNNRTDRKMLHSVKCESLEVMSTKAYDKLFFEDVNQAKNWLDKKYGTSGWEVCGRCC